MEDKEIPAEISINVKSADSFGANDNNSTYRGLHEIFPTIENPTPDLSAITEDAINIFEVFGKGLAELNNLRAIFTQDGKLDPTDLVEGESTHIETPPDNGETTSLLTKSPSQYTDPVDAPDDPDSPPPGPQVDASGSTCVAGNLPRERLTAANDKLFGVY